MQEEHAKTIEYQSVILRKPGKEETLEARSDGFRSSSKVMPVKVKWQGLTLEATSR